VKAERLEREFSERAVPNGDGLLLFRQADALTLVSRAAEEGVPIREIAGFRLGESTTEPLAEHREDFSSAVAEGHGCWREAEEFVGRRDAPGVLFRLRLGSDPIEAV